MRVPCMCMCEGEGGINIHVIERSELDRNYDLSDCNWIHIA